MGVERRQWILSVRHRRQTEPKRRRHRLWYKPVAGGETAAEWPPPKPTATMITCVRRKTEWNTGGDRGKAMRQKGIREKAIWGGSVGETCVCMCVCYVNPRWCLLSWIEVSPGGRLLRLSRSLHTSRSRYLALFFDKTRANRRQRQKELTRKHRYHKKIKDCRKAKTNLLLKERREGRSTPSPPPWFGGCFFFPALPVVTGLLVTSQCG